VTARAQIVGLPGVGSRFQPPLADGERQPGHAAQRRRAERDWPSYEDMVGRLAVLERSAVFFALSQSTLRALASRLRRVTIAAGEIIVGQGEPGDTIFFIEKGRCRFVIERPPSAVTVAQFIEGDFFGECACLLNRPQQASVYAETDCALLALDRQRLYTVLGRDQTALDELPKFAEQRFKTFADTTVQATWGMLLQEGAVVGVYSPKGGSGGTSISLNLVGSLAHRYPGQVLLIDLDFPFAHSALLAGLVPSSSLARTASAPPEAFEDVLLSSVIIHPAGPVILAGALRPEEADEVTPELVSRAIGVLRKRFRFIVVDLGVAINDSMLAILDLTQHVVLVATPELSAVKSAADAIDILIQLGTPHDRLVVVLNNRSPKATVTRSAIEQILKRQVDLEVAYDGTRPDQAAVNGEILSLSNPRSETARGAEALADLLEPRHGRSGPVAAPIIDRMAAQSPGRELP
jgi:Flp pilus assembly CpaE family ATPase